MADIKKKTLLTAYSRMLAIVMSIVYQLVLTPIILSFWGTTLYGIYVIINKTNNFLSIVDVRPTAILRLKLAHDQLSEDIQDKRKYIGASYVISLLFLPIFVIGGLIIAYFSPDIFHIDNIYVDESRYAIILLSILLSFNGFWGVPEAILRGNNLEYKSFFVEPIRLLLVACFTILFLCNGWGILSVVFAMFMGSLFSYVSRLILRRLILKDYSASRPSAVHIKYFFNKGGWYMISSFLMQLINNFDVILIGILMSPEAVTLFAITKAIVFRLVESLEVLVTSATTGVGEIIGSMDKGRMSMARMNIIDLVLPLSLFVASYFFLFNEPLISYWTNSSVYAGNTVNILICFSAIFLMLTCVEEIFVISSLNFKEKSLCLLSSALIAIVSSVVFNQPFGLAGNAMGILLGRITLFFLYNNINNKLIGKRIVIGLDFSVKLLIYVVIIGFIKVYFIDYFTTNVIHFIIGSGLFMVLAGCYTYYLLLKDSTRKQLLGLVIKGYK